MSTITVVIDTNVCLDLFVFKDPRWQQLMQQLCDGSITAITRKECREEWLSVLHYQHLPINDENRTQFQAQFDQYIQCVDASNKNIKLPICTDKDDQKFLEISRDAGVDVLITHIGGYPGKYNQVIREELTQNPPKLFICGHSHILKVMFDKKLNFLHMNPGAAGISGFHQVRTMLRFEIEGDKIQNLEIVELGNRG